MKKTYPSIYRSLITDRDVYMARNLYKISNLHKDEKIVAVLGAGHIEGIIKLLKKQKWERKTVGKKQKK